MTTTRINVDVDIDDILWNMSDSERQQLVDDLYDDGFVPEQVKAISDREELIQSGGSMDFDAQVYKLIGNSWRLSREDEDLILKIANKLII
jgi:hypothetical protein